MKELNQSLQGEANQINSLFENDLDEDYQMPTPTSGNKNTKIELFQKNCLRPALFLIETHNPTIKYYKLL